MWYDKEAKKLYTIGIMLARPDDLEEAYTVSEYIDELRNYTGDELCLDQGKSAALSNQTLHLNSILLALFGMLLAIERLENLKKFW